MATDLRAREPTKRNKHSQGEEVRSREEVRPRE
jgi:hypothetical protein